MQHDSRVPYSKVGLEALAQAMNITTAAMYVDPVTNSFRVRESFNQPTVAGHPGDHSASGLSGSALMDLEEEAE